ncbi:MAG: hypothetical protein AAGG48_23320 [Planctomycetota bacterium]
MLRKPIIVTVASALGVTEVQDEARVPDVVERKQAVVTQGDNMYAPTIPTIRSHSDGVPGNICGRGKGQCKPTRDGC